jgi:plastocyanin
MKSSLVVATLLLASVGADASAATYIIGIKDMAFGRPPAGLAVGDTVTWKNSDVVWHTVTARDGSFDHRLLPGESVSITLQKDGALTIYCRYHPEMTVRLTVAKKRNA